MVKGHERPDGCFCFKFRTIDNNIFINGWNHENAYTFGWVLSDGCLLKEGRNKTSYAVRISSNDYDVISWLHNYMCVGNKIYQQGKNYVIKFRNKESVEFMMRHNLVERKSLVLKFPDIPDEYFWDFVRGYFDGDGSIILRNTRYNLYGQVSITSGSIDFLNALQLKLQEHGVVSHIYKDGRSTNRSFYLQVIKRKELENLFFAMYQNKDKSFFLNRKYEKFKTLVIDNHPKYNIK